MLKITRHQLAVKAYDIRVQQFDFIWRPDDQDHTWDDRRSAIKEFFKIDLIYLTSKNEEKIMQAEIDLIRMDEADSAAIVNKYLGEQKFKSYIDFLRSGPGYESRVGVLKRQAGLVNWETTSETVHFEPFYKKLFRFKRER